MTPLSALSLASQPKIPAAGKRQRAIYLCEPAAGDAMALEGERAVQDQRRALLDF